MLKESYGEERKRKHQEFQFLHPLPAAVCRPTIRTINLNVKIYRKTKPTFPVEGVKEESNWNLIIALTKVTE